MGPHKMVNNLGNKINAIQNFFATTTDSESRDQEFESSRANQFVKIEKSLPFMTILIILVNYENYI